MPEQPSVIVASGFRGLRPKAVVNKIGVSAVGAVFGVYGLSQSRSKSLAKYLASIDLRGRLVTHSNGLRKLEPRQLFSLVAGFLAE